MANDTYDDTVGREIRANIKAALKARGMSQRSLADEIGIPRGTVTAMLSGSDRVTLRVAMAASRALGISLDSVTVPSLGAMSGRGQVTTGGAVLNLPFDDLYQLTVDKPLASLGLRLGDVLTVSRREDPAPGDLAIIGERGSAEATICAVQGDSPMVLVRDGAPAVVFDPAYHTLEGVVTHLSRHLRRVGD